MKVLQINCVYNVGSTGKIVYDLARYLTEQGHESVVCYGRGSRTNDPNVYKISSEFEAKVHSALSRAFGVDFAHSPLATHRLVKLIEQERPDVVHLHCLNGHFVNVYRLLEYLKRAEIKTVLTLHAELMYTAGCGYAFDCEKWKTGCSHCSQVRGIFSRLYQDDARCCFQKMQKAFEEFHNLKIVGCSQWISERAKSSVIMSSFPICTIHNGIDSDVFQYTDPAHLKAELTIPQDKKIILNVTPSFRNTTKGGKYLIECAKVLQEYQFIVAGFDGDKSLLPKNVLPIAFTASRKELAQLYSLADCMLITSLRENYPTVVIEATSCGCPIVGFRTGGIPETIPVGMGECVDCFDVEQMVEAAKRWSNVIVPAKLVTTVNRNNSWITMGKKYLELYRNC